MCVNQYFICIFATAYESEVSVCKKSMARLSYYRNFAKVSRGRTELLLSLDVYAIGFHAEAYSQA